MEGDVGAADAAFPELQTAVESTKGFHQWLWSISISTARAEAALLGGRPDRAEEHAREALAYAERIGRRKYVCRARTALGQALLELGRLDDAVGSLEGAAAEADALGHLPVGVVVGSAGGGGARATPRERRRIAREPTSRRSPPGRANRAATCSPAGPRSPRSAPRGRSLHRVPRDVAEDPRELVRLDHIGQWLVGRSIQVMFRTSFTPASHA